MLYTVMIQAGMWLTDDDDGDPPRTLVIGNATAYTYTQAEIALKKASLWPGRDGYPDAVIQEIPQPITAESLVTDGWETKGNDGKIYEKVFSSVVNYGTTEDAYISVDFGHPGGLPAISLVIYYYDYDYDDKMYAPLHVKTMQELRTLYALLSGQSIPEEAKR